MADCGVDTIRDYVDGGHDGWFDMYDGGSPYTTQVSHSFHGWDGQLNSCKFRLGKGLSPTGNIYAKLYLETHATAFGTDSIPTGSALATSDPVDVSTLPDYVVEGCAWTTFTFSTPYTLSSGVDYCIVFDIGTCGDYSNYIRIETDATYVAHAGNTASFVPGYPWDPTAVEEIEFYLCEEVSQEYYSPLPTFRPGV